MKLTFSLPGAFLVSRHGCLDIRNKPSNLQHAWNGCPSAQLPPCSRCQLFLPPRLTSPFSILAGPFNLLLYTPGPGGTEAHFPGAPRDWLARQFGFPLINLGHLILTALSRILTVPPVILTPLSFPSQNQRYTVDRDTARRLATSLGLIRRSWIISRPSLFWQNCSNPIQDSCYP